MKVKQKGAEMIQNADIVAYVRRLSDTDLKQLYANVVNHPFSGVTEYKDIVSAEHDWRGFGAVVKPVQLSLF